MNPTAMTARAVVCAAIALGMTTVVACSSDQSSQTQGAGSISIPLSISVGSNNYRLDAVFAIVGDQGNVTLSTRGDEPTLSTTLAAGAYDILLESFTLSKDDGTGTFNAVAATAVASSIPFTVTANATTTVSFQFLTDGMTVSPGAGNVAIGFGVTDTTTNSITVDTAARTVQSARFFLDFSNAVPDNPEDLDVLRWAGGPNLLQSFALDACTSNVVEHFGNSWAAADPNFAGTVLVGSGSSGSWEQDGGSILIHSASSGCSASSSATIETRYRFGEGAAADTIEVEREFDFRTAHLNAFFDSFRPFIPRMSVAFDRVLHPNAARTSLVSENVLACPFGCQPSDWDGSWYAYYASSGAFAGQGMIALRGASAVAATLWIDNDSGNTDTNASGVLLLPPPNGFPQTITEKELLCFFDAQSWTPADQATLTLPPGCN